MDDKVVMRTKHALSREFRDRRYSAIFDGIKTLIDDTLSEDNLRPNPRSAFHVSAAPSSMSSIINSPQALDVVVHECT